MLYLLYILIGYADSEILAHFYFWCPQGP